MIIFIANQFIGEKISTGGDVLFLEVLKRTTGKRVIVAPEYIHAAILRNVSPLNFVDSDRGRPGRSASNLCGGISTVWTYVHRAILTYRWLLRNASESDVIYLTGDFICNTLPVWMLKLSGKCNMKVYANFYHRNPPPRQRPGNSYFISAGSRLLQRVGLRIIRNTAQAVFVLSDIGKEELLREGFDANKIVISGAGIDSSIAKYRNAQRCMTRFIYVGRLNITKGAFDLINILGLLNRSKLDFECSFIGEGSDSDVHSLEMLAEEAGVRSKIELKGYVSEDEKLGLLGTSCALVFPSKEEGYGIAVHEALYLDVPVICYELPVLKSIFGRNDLINFVPMNNQQAFADRMEKILRQQEPNNDRSPFEDKSLQTWDDVFAIQSRYFGSSFHGQDSGKS